MWLQHFVQQFFIARLWGFIGVLLAIIFGITTLILTLDQSKTSILFEIVNESNVLDVRQPLTDLQILFRGEELQEKNLNLRIFTLRLENNGDSDILQNHFDQSDIWGFNVLNGDVIEIRLTGSNSQYIEQTLNPREIEENVVQFDKVIFESGIFFTLEMLVLHSKDVVPSIQPVGKIAGIERVVLITRSATEDKPSFMNQFLQGSILIHILRAVAYIVVTILLIIFLIFASIGLTKLYALPGKRLRRKAMTSAVHQAGLNSKIWPEAVLEIYANDGEEPLLELSDLLSKEEQLRLRVLAMDRFRKRPARYPNARPVGRGLSYKSSNLLLALMEEGTIRYDESSNEAIIDPEFRDGFVSLLEALDR